MAHCCKFACDQYYCCEGREAPLVLLLFNAGPLDVTFAQESPEVDAIIACGYPSQATGEALYRVLTGTGPHAVPAGRLPATWPAQLNQVSFCSHFKKNTLYAVLKITAYPLISKVVCHLQLLLPS